MAVTTALLWALLAAPAAAASGNPTVIAVHRAAAVDVHGGSVARPVAAVTLPKGTWSIIAKATMQGTDVTTISQCNLIAGSDTDWDRVHLRSSGVFSYQDVLLMVAHKFTATGTAHLDCETDGNTGDVLARDVRIIATKIGKLTKDGTTSGTGSPRVIMASNDTATTVPGTLVYSDLDHVDLPAGAWAITGKGWAFASAAAEVDCKLMSGGAALDLTSVNTSSGAYIGYGLLGVTELSSAGSIHLLCESNELLGAGNTRLTAMRVGTLTLSNLGSGGIQVGSGSPVVVAGRLDGSFAIPAALNPSTIGTLALPAGTWAISAKLYALGSGSATSVTCQLVSGSDVDQARVKVDGGTPTAWMGLAITHHLSVPGTVKVRCDQSGATNQVGGHFLRIVAVKLGSLRDSSL